VEAHCAEVQRQHHLQVLLFTDGEVEPASRLIALSLFRIAQEALHNAVRHGRARRATVSLAQHDDELTLLVEDDGRGFDVAAAQRNGGLGLASIEERTRLIRGRLRVRSRAGQGTTVEVRVPTDDNCGHVPATDDGAVAVRASGYEPQH
jgi:signal transduction histidine kinase